MQLHAEAIKAVRSEYQEKTIGGDPHVGSVFEPKSADKAHMRSADYKRTEMHI